MSLEQAHGQVLPEFGDAVRQRLLAFISKNYGVDACDVDLDESLVDQGVLDSFGMVELASFIEKDFRLPLAESDMTKQNFGSVTLMVGFISGRLRMAAHGTRI